MGDDVVRQRVGEDLVLGLLALDAAGHAVLQLLHTGRARTGRRLVRGHDDALDLEALMDREQRHERDGGGAVRVGDESLAVGGADVDLRHDEWNSVLVAKGGRIVDDQHPGLGELLRPLEGEIAAHSEEDHIECLGDFKIKRFKNQRAVDGALDGLST